MKWKVEAGKKRFYWIGQDYTLPNLKVQVSFDIAIKLAVRCLTINTENWSLWTIANYIGAEVQTGYFVRENCMHRSGFEPEL